MVNKYTKHIYILLTFIEKLTNKYHVLCSKLENNPLITAVVIRVQESKYTICAERK